MKKEKKKLNLASNFIELAVKHEIQEEMCWPWDSTETSGDHEIQQRRT